MFCEFTFLDVGNADSLVILPELDPSVIVDIPNPRIVTDWLTKKNRYEIGCIYITHAHHDHFVPLVKFVAFLEQWLEVGGTISNLILSHDTLRSAFDDLSRLESSDEKKFNQLHHALDRLDSWRENEIHLDFHFRSSSPSYSHGNLSVRVLHPELFFSARHTSSAEKKLNERSLLLKVCYGDFAAVLLADLEGEGLSECLRICTDPELKAHLVKIPHHGAWPKNPSDLESLLRKIDPEIAVLSVGSQNRYGHVTPELFKLLIQLQSDKLMKLQQFLCTEATRTCKYSRVDRASMGKIGLPNKLPCAGDITVIAETSGNWDVQTQTDHSLIVGRMEYAACEGRADI